MRRPILRGAPPSSRTISNRMITATANSNAYEEHRDRGLDLHALPGQRDPAGVIREPRRDQGQRHRDHQEQDEPDHPLSRHSTG